MGETKNKCFIIMPISDTDGYKKGHWQEVYNHLIKPAVEQAGYIPERADEIRSANLIAVDIIKRICEYPMAICDLSACNPNVFYELGIRHSKRLPVVLIKDTKTTNPFDIKDIRYIEYDAWLSVAEIPSKQNELATTISQTKESFESGDSFYNSLFTILNINTASQYKQELPSIAFVEQMANDLCSKITSSRTSEKHRLELEKQVLEFKELCDKYDNGYIIWNYVDNHFRNKFRNIYFTIV